MSATAYQSKVCEWRNEMNSGPQPQLTGLPNRVAGTVAGMIKIHLPPSARLRQLAVLTRNHPRVTVADLLGLGKLLLEAKRLRPHGEWAIWLASVPLSVSDATIAMRVARRIILPREQLETVRASTARVLTRTKVLRSKKLTEAAMSAPRDKNGMITMRSMQSAISTVDPWAVHNAGEVKEGPVEALGRRLLLLENDITVTSVFVSFDRDDKDGVTTASVTVMREGGRQTVTRMTVEAAIATLSGEEIAVLCKPCGRNLLPASFSKGSHNCKRCERERVGAYTREKRKKNAETRKRIEEMDG